MGGLYSFLLKYSSLYKIPQIILKLWKFTGVCELPGQPFSLIAAFNVACNSVTHWFDTFFFFDRRTNPFGESGRTKSETEGKRAKL